MTKDPPPRLPAPGWGEAPPTAGLPPRWRDLLAPGGGSTFETSLCERFGLPDIEITSSGTAALVIAFACLKERNPDRNIVIVPAYTCPLVVIAAAVAGLEVIACDTNAGGFELDAFHLARLAGPSTLAVVPTHYGGVLTDVDSVRRVVDAAAPGCAIVEDAAQAFGATWNGHSAGLAGDIGVYSFGAGKGLTIYEGGALVARDKTLMADLRGIAARIIKTSPIAEFGRDLMLAGYHAAYNEAGVRIAYGVHKRRALARGDEIDAAGDRFSPAVPIRSVGSWRKRVGRAALGRLDAHLLDCRTRFDALATRLSAISGLSVHRSPAGAEPSATSLCVSLPPHPERDLFIRALWRSRLGVARMFTRAIGDFPDCARLLRPSQTPHARDLAASTITISTSSLLSRVAEDAIVSALEAFMRTNGGSA